MPTVVASPEASVRHHQDSNFVEISLYAVDLGHKAGLGLLCADETCLLQRLGQGLASLRFQGKLLAGAICIANRKCSMYFCSAALSDAAALTLAGSLWAALEELLSEEAAPQPVSSTAASAAAASSAVQACIRSFFAKFIKKILSISRESGVLLPSGTPACRGAACALARLTVAGPRGPAPASPVEPAGSCGRVNHRDALVPCTRLLRMLVYFITPAHKRQERTLHSPSARPLAHG